jgi:hypothetical protein
MGHPAWFILDRIKLRECQRSTCSACIAGMVYTCISLLTAAWALIPLLEIGRGIRLQVCLGTRLLLYGYLSAMDQSLLGHSHERKVPRGPFYPALLHHHPRTESPRWKKIVSDEFQSMLAHGNYLRHCPKTEHLDPRPPSQATKLQSYNPPRQVASTACTSNDRTGLRDHSYPALLHHHPGHVPSETYHLVTTRLYPSQHLKVTIGSLYTNFKQLQSNHTVPNNDPKHNTFQINASIVFTNMPVHN